MKPTFDYSSVFKIGSHGLVSLVVSGFIANVALAAPASNALPTGGTVASGSVNIATNAATMNINQASSRSVINWNTYNIGSAATVNYNFAQSGSSSLNRVLSNNPTEIYGRLNANGKVILVNPNGIVFGSGSSVNVGSLVATTMNIKDADYLNDKLVFTRDGSIGKILNEGSLTAEDKGYIALLAPEVVNKGVIKATMGTVSMAAGEKIELTLDASGLKTVILEPSAIKTLIDNKALIEAKGGVVYLGAKEANAILDTVMNLKNSGIVEATALNNTNGKIILDGDNIEVDGTLKATQVYAGNKSNAKTVVKATATLEGEFVETSGKVLAVENGAKIKAKTWLLDPTDVTIDSSTDAIGGATVGASVIQTALGSGSVLIAADNDISVNSNISWSANTLTLTAGNDINVNAVMTASGAAALTMNTGASGNINMGMNANKTAFVGKIDYSASGALTINNDVYTVISDRAGLEAIGTNDTSLAGKYVLGSNINLTGSNWTPIGDGGVVDNGDYFTPGSNGDYYRYFTGSFNGLGHAVSNMTISSNDTNNYVNGLGFFGTVQNAKISNIAVTNASITIDGQGGSGIGILVGQVYSEGGASTLRNIITSGTIQGNASINDVGGMLGRLNVSYNNGDQATVSNAHSDVVLNGDLDYDIGGLIGAIGSGIDNGVLVRDSSAKSTITSTHQYGSDYGGLVGAAYGDSTNATSIVFDRVFADTVITGNRTDNMGGLIGGLESAGTIKESYAISELNNGRQKIGGLVGVTDNNVNIERSFAQTTINSGSYYRFSNVGGLVGSANTTLITDSYAIGTITSDISAISGVDIATIGGLAGFAYDVAINRVYAKVDIDIKTGALDGSNWEAIWGVGGFIGEFDANGDITNSGALGNVKVQTGNLTDGHASVYAAGFIGYLGTWGDSATINNNFTSGTFEVATGTLGTGSSKFTGGFIGSYGANSGDVAANPGDATITANKFAVADSLGTTTAVNPAALATYGASGLTFDLDTVWAQDSAKNNGLPYLRWAASMFGGGSTGGGSTGGGSTGGGSTGGGSTGGGSTGGGSTGGGSNTTTTTAPVEVVVSQIADNVVKNVEKSVTTPQTTTPTTFAATSQMVTPPSVVQVVQPVNNEGSATQGGAIVNTGGSTQISFAVAASANPFAANDNISVIGGGVKVASAELPNEVKSDVKPSGIVGSAMPSMVVVKQLAPQKGVELAVVAPSTNTADSKISAKVTTDAGSGFSFTVKEAVNVNVAQKDIKEVKATLDNGQSLPAWLQFDAKTQTFKAVNPPANALPISTKVSITTKAGQTQQVAVEISK